MSRQCPSCYKLCSLEMQDPEVNDLSFDLESRTVTAEVRIVRNSACCGDEMKEYTFNTEQELDDEMNAKIDAILEKEPDADIDVQEGSVDQLEEGGSRYAKSYFGYTLEATITVARSTAPRTASEQTELDRLDAIGYSNQTVDERERRKVLSEKGKPKQEEIGTVELQDKCAASEMDELT